tara:strand:+ start:114 stop:332 length:219 start_codon:yes stop_codon:yes gene_type:complete
MFKKIRGMQGFTGEEYLKSVGPEQLLGNMILGNLSSLSELSSEGKSGAFFYYTADGNSGGPQEEIGHFEKSK